MNAEEFVAGLKEISKPANSDEISDLKKAIFAWFQAVPEELFLDTFRELAAMPQNPRREVMRMEIVIERFQIYLTPEVADKIRPHHQFTMNLELAICIADIITLLEEMSHRDV